MKARKNELVGGLLLIGFGILALAGQFVDFSDMLGLMILPLLSAGFLLAGIVTRNIGFLIPGGILGGIGLGAFLIEGPMHALEGDAEGAVFMLSFALGWVLITVLSAAVTRRTHWWPLIPGGIMALIGGGLLFGGMFMATLELLSTVWPLFLILIGAYILYQGYVQNSSKEKYIE